MKRGKHHKAVQMYSTGIGLKIKHTYVCTYIQTER